MPPRLTRNQREIAINQVTLTEQGFVRVWFVMKRPRSEEYDFCRGRWDSDAFPIERERYRMYIRDQTNNSFTLVNRLVDRRRQSLYTGTLIRITNCTIIGRDLLRGDQRDGAAEGTQVELIFLL